jgi:ABC-type bacteriocin/lantibiotic exporter with double-glycine peptidase domain
MFKLSDYRKSTLFLAWQLLNKYDKLKIKLLIFFQLLVNLLDLIGVVLIAGLGALLIQGVDSNTPGNKVGKLLDILNLRQYSFENQIVLLSLLVTCLFILKTFLSAMLTRKIFSFMSNRSSLISEKMISSIFSQNLLVFQKYTFSEISFSIITGIDLIMTSILASYITIIVDISMVFLLLIGISAINASVALSALVFYVLLGLFLHTFLRSKTFSIGQDNTKLVVESNEKIFEATNLYREIVVRNKQINYIKNISRLRHALGVVNSERNFQPYISKYVFELALVLGMMIIAVYQFANSLPTYAVATIAAFIAASSRIAPAILRIQQSFLVIRLNTGSTTMVFQMISNLEKANSLSVPDSNTEEVEDFRGDVVLNSVNFKYSETDVFALTNINLNIFSGTSLGLIGPSGGGKSTLADLILGMFPPNSGTIKISGCDPAATSKRWPNKVSYVPQQVFLVRGSIKKNLSIGFEVSDFTDEDYWRALNLANLEEFVRTLTDGLDTLVGEGNLKISGGQRQRMGIARALLTEPGLIILDESTNALDRESEAEISRTIENLKGNCTVIVIAHSLSTIKSLDRIAYIENGKIVASGSLNEIINTTPNFKIK